MDSGNTTTARKAILKAYGDSRNFVTPDIEGFDVVNGYAVEYSSGSAFLSPGRIYGVSIVTLAGERRNDLSESGFSTLEDAKAHAERVTR